MNLVDLHRLKPHPKNEDYFADITGEKYEEIKRSIEIHGIRDPLKVLSDFTILAGHQRFRIAKELGQESMASSEEQAAQLQELSATVTGIRTIADGLTKLG